jgi:hypothetical protein
MNQYEEKRLLELRQRVKDGEAAGRDREALGSAIGALNKASRMIADAEDLQAARRATCHYIWALEAIAPAVKGLCERSRAALEESMTPDEVFVECGKLVNVEDDPPSLVLNRAELLPAHYFKTVVDRPKVTKALVNKASDIPPEAATLGNGGRHISFRSTERKKKAA